MSNVIELQFGKRPEAAAEPAVGGAEIKKFPYSVSRRAHSKKPRRSKNGTPEERAAKAAGTQQAPADVVLIDRRKLRGNPMRDYIPTISFGATVCGKLYTMDLKGEPLSEIPTEVRIEWLSHVHHATEALSKVAAGLAETMETLTGCISGEEIAAIYATLPLDTQAVLSARMRECLSMT
jgi:hypothetical protein